MGFGSIILGLASLALGVNQLSNGLSHLSNNSRKRPPAPPVPARAAQKRVSSRKTSNRKTASRKGLSSGMSVSMKEVRSLDDRIKHIQTKVRKGKVDPDVYALARKIVTQKCGANWCTPEKDNLAEAKAVYDYLRKNVRYTSDPLGVDAYAAAKHTLKMGAADCDDYSITACSLLLSLGIPCRLKVIQTTGSSEPNHIYAQVGLPRANPTKWHTMDASVAKPFGWEAPRSMIQKSWIYRAE